MTFTVTTVLAVVAVVGIAALGHTVAGFGFSLLAVPGLSAVIDAKDAVAVSLVLLLVNSALLSWGERDHIDWPAVGVLLRGAVLGLPVGLLVLTVASTDVLRVILALAVLATVALLLSGYEAGRASRRLEWGSGLACGVLTTSITANGPPVALALQARGLSPATFRASVSTVLGLASLAGSVLFVTADRMTSDVGATLVVATPAMVAGWGVGVVVRRRVPADWFRRCILGLLVVAALVTLASVLVGS